MIVVVNLNPYRTREATVWLDLPALGVDRPFVVTDELTGESYWWGRANYVRLDPATRPAHIFTVTPGALQRPDPGMTQEITQCQNNPTR